MRRFILLIDELYQHRVKVVITSEADVQHIFKPNGHQQHAQQHAKEDFSGIDEVFAFDRTVSRLTEMQTRKYLESPHISLSGVNLTHHL